MQKGEQRIGNAVLLIKQAVYMKEVDVSAYTLRRFVHILQVAEYVSVSCLIRFSETDLGIYPYFSVFSPDREHLLISFKI